jgi:hypothetical protein
MIFENKLLGFNWQEVEGGWLKLHNEEFNDLYFSPNTVEMLISRRI